MDSLDRRWRRGVETELKRIERSTREEVDIEALLREECEDSGQVVPDCLADSAQAEMAAAQLIIPQGETVFVSDLQYYGGCHEG